MKRILAAVGRPSSSLVGPRLGTTVQAGGQNLLRTSTDRGGLKYAVVLLAIFLLAACGDSGGSSGATSSEGTAPEALEPIQLEGRLTTLFVMKGECDDPDTYVANPNPSGVDEIFHELETIEAINRIKNVEKRTILIRDEEGELVAEATTASDAELIDTGKHKGQFKQCFAVGDWSAQLPGSTTYTMTVKALQGSPPAVSHEELEELDFECTMFVNPDAKGGPELISGSAGPCGDLSESGLPD